ncbi:MAG TPA: protein-L-isoaspartate(D-aspartate) O-methyltransferase [Burkholderiales bacterium]|nr:protein-L-isoaspartate(D-aspartate) O-methyltransferase [Burkholderiales bacterium]
MDEQQFAALRQQMLLEIVADTLFTKDRIGSDTLDARVMEVMGKVPRHEFVPIELQPYAYLNRPLPIGFEKTISQPFIVALMTDLLQLQEEDTVLEIGTGLGYHAAILAELGREVYTIEIIGELARQATTRLSRLRYANIEIKVANGYYGWPQHAPFDKVIVTAAPDLIPPPLLNQLRPGGRMVIPAGLPDHQQLILVEKDSGGRVTTREILPVRFSQLEEGDFGQGPVS